MHQHPITAALAGLVILVMTMGASQTSAPAPTRAPTGWTTSPTATSAGRGGSVDRDGALPTGGLGPDSFATPDRSEDAIVCPGSSRI